MQEPGRLTAAAPADLAAAPGTAHPAIALFDRVRELLVAAGLPPEPDLYETLYHHVSLTDAALSRAIDECLREGRLTAAELRALRRQHFGELCASELVTLLEGADRSGRALASLLDRSEAEVEAFDRNVRSCDRTLAQAATECELNAGAACLRQEAARMLAASRRMAAELSHTRVETAALIERLEAAERAARTDPLTGLLNRRGVLDALNQAVAAAAEAGEPLAAAMVDIDHFHRFNAQWGHAVGDEVLRCIGQHVAQQARSLCPAAATGRYGGEEFLVVLPGTPLNQAAAMLDQARAALARQVLRRADDGANLGHVKVSAGVAALRPDDTPEALVDRADSALFAAKRAGRDRVVPERPRR